MSFGIAEYTVGLFLIQGSRVARTDVLEVKLNVAPSALQFPGAACRAARRLLGLSQAELTALSGLAKKTINDAENGRVEPSVRTLAALRAALERAGADFMVGDGVIAVRVVTGSGS